MTTVQIIQLSIVGVCFVVVVIAARDTFRNARRAAAAAEQAQAAADRAAAARARSNTARVEIAHLQNEHPPYDSREQQ